MLRDGPSSGGLRWGVQQLRLCGTPASAGAESMPANSYTVASMRTHLVRPRPRVR
jgi:hypothetical protein